MDNEQKYWITLAHLPRWGNLKINNLIIKFFHENKLSIIEFFQISEKDLRMQYELNDHQIFDLQKAKSNLNEASILTESLINQNIEIIPIVSPEYSRNLKLNLKKTSPPILYLKGDKRILEEKSVAIVGSRKASQVSLDFTDNIAKISSKEFKVVVSGFAKGVDKQALDSAISNYGKSIIVLPQGILTFSLGLKKYNSQIMNGEVLVLSSFYPKAIWKVELAMARNPIIYGLANDIFVAESSEKGGTWSGVLDGLRKGRKIYVRQPSFNEINSNINLIKKGAIAVDFNGQEIKSKYPIELPNQLFLVNDNNAESESLDTKVQILLNGKIMSSKDILSKLNLKWSAIKLTSHLKKLDFLEFHKDKGKMMFKLKNYSPSTQTRFFH